MELQQNAYSWHQSHDQATVLLVVPYESTEEDVLFFIDRNHIAAGVHGRPPLVKGHLYGQIDVSTSTWQLEPGPSSLSGRERKISSTSTASTQSSYSMISDPEISSSFSGAIDIGQTSDTEDISRMSSAVSSPLHSSPDERSEYPALQGWRLQSSASRPLSPHLRPLSVTSSMSSLESSHSSRSGRLLTLHLEKAESAIWPCLISGPAPGIFGIRPINPLSSDEGTELKYNMDPTSLMLLGSDLLDIRRDQEEAFEYFLRAWTFGRIPYAALRLITHYLPLQSLPVAPVVEESPQRGSIGYYFKCLEGAQGLSELYVTAGFLHLEGTASRLLATPYSPLSSIRLSSEGFPLNPGLSDTEAWHRDRETANAYFSCAKALNPTLDVPTLLAEDQEQAHPNGDVDFNMPSINIRSPESKAATTQTAEFSDRTTGLRRRRQNTVTAAGGAGKQDAPESTWYLYLPGLVGAGTALLVVGVIGAINLSWKKNQSS